MRRCEVKINCVILNYNDASTTIKLMNQLCGYPSVERIVIVDNASTDDSWEQLHKFCRENESAAEKADLLRSDKNGGYGFGNNLGVRYAFHVNRADHILIANPDIMVSESCIKALSSVLERHDNVAVVTAKMEDQTYGEMKNGWKLHGFWGELLSMGPLSMRLFKKFLQYPESYFEGKKAVYVDAVHGSMLMVDGRKFVEAGGYDEGIFLYQEEAVLASRLKQCGYKTTLLLNQNYRHEHSVSIKKSFKGQIDRQKLRNQSVLYYLKQYQNIDPIRSGIARLWFAGILLEIRMASLMGIL